MKIKKYFIIIIICIVLLLESFLILSKMKLSFNVSPSLPFKVFLVDTKKKDNFKNGDFIQFKNSHTKYYFGKKITKQVLAKEGDILDIKIFDKPKDNIQGTIEYNNNVLFVKYKTKLGTIVNINKTVKIPEDKLFVIGYDDNSFDSRYEEFGLIDKKEVIGVAKPLF